MPIRAAGRSPRDSAAGGHHPRPGDAARVRVPGRSEEGGRERFDLLLSTAERVVRSDASRASRVVVTAASFVAALAVAAADYVTGAGLNLSAFYVLIVVAITASSGLRIGLVGAAFTATAAAISDALIRELGLSAMDDVWNAAVVFVALATVAVLVAALIRAVGVAQASERSSREFLATVAHQLRTPVAAIRTSVDALVNTPPGPTQERLLANVGTDASRIGRVLASLLRMARLDQGEGLRLRPVQLRPLLTEELERMGELSPVEADLVVAPDAPAVVEVDVDATREAVANLLDNARRHAATRVTVEVAAVRGGVTISVGDDGPGLPAGAEEAAFGRFVSLDGGAGSGLGLPIARALARLQGGDIAYSQKRFVLSLPAADVSLSPARGPRT